MTDQSGSNGASPQSEEVQGEQLHPAIQAVAGVLYVFAPHLGEEQAILLANACLNEETQLQPIFQDCVNPEKREKYPRWGFRIMKDKQEIIRSVAPKELTPGTELNEFFAAVHTVAMLTSPIARGILRANGFDIQFMQMAAPTKILLPGS